MKKKIKYGKVNIPKEEFSKMSRICITLKVPGYVLDTYLELSTIHGMTYEDLMVQDLSEIAELERNHRRLIQKV